MADITQVQTAVAQRLTDVNNFVSDTIGQVQSFLTDLQAAAEQLQIPYPTSPPGYYLPTPIDMTVPEPSRPSIITPDISPLPLFTPATITVPPMPNINTEIPPIKTDFVWNETLDPVAAQLLDILLARMNAPSDIDLGAVWDRMTERDEKRNQASVQKIADKWASFGWDLPQGGMAEEIRSVLADYDDKKFDQSRDIAYEEAKLSLEDKQFSIRMMVEAAGIIMQHADAVKNRALTAARSVVEFGIAAYNAMIARFNAQLQAYRIQADIDIQNSELQDSIEDRRLRAFLGNIEVIKTNYELVFEKLRTLVAVYGADISKFSAVAGLKEAQGRIQVSQQELVLKDLETNKEIILRQAIANLEAFIKIAETKISAATAGGNIWANALSGAYQAVTTLVHLSDSAESTYISSEGTTGP